MMFETNKKPFLTTSKALFAIVSILLVIIAFLATSEATANMFGIFKKHDVHLSPAVKARLVKRGVALKITELSYKVIKWIFDKTLGTLYKAAQRAVDVVF
ncbi:hypothetical protein ACMAZF_19455 [Psychrobium sp. nBUS_13]|uniref:hypothetical protein n=1 Tax=Psychrobium sp. nBUS_13 TaxID=3395319 RepID=UPI003EBD086E